MKIISCVVLLELLAGIAPSWAAAPTLSYDGRTVSLSAENQTFGQVTSAYRDNANTNDPGGRIVQIVGRINF